LDAWLRRHYTVRNAIGIIAVVAVAAVIWAIFFWRTNVNQQQHDRLCGVIAAIVQAANKSLGKPNTPGYFYYSHHPSELALAHKLNTQTLQYLGCKPAVLVPLVPPVKITTKS
jgi:hypothetical protein